MLESGGDHITREHLHFLTMPIAGKDNPKPPPVKKAAPMDVERLVNKRSTGVPTDNLESDESRIMQYVREHGMINNTDCRELLGVDRHRANYLLKKLNQYDLLHIVGSGRWAVYRLNQL